LYYNNKKEKIKTKKGFKYVLTEVETGDEGMMRRVRIDPR